MDEIAHSQISPGTYDGLAGLIWLENRLNDALHDCRVVAFKRAEVEPSRLQTAMLGVVSTGISTAQSVFQLLKLGFLPAADALCRPLFEYAGISNMLLADDKWVEFWEDGWPQKGRPSLTDLIAHISGEKVEERNAIHRMANDFHNAVHVNLATVKRNLAPAPDGELVHWLGPIPTDPDRVEKIAYATALCAVVLASNAKGAFFWGAR